MLRAGAHDGLEALGEACRTPLLVAAAGGHAAVVKLLVEAGADVNARDSSGKVPLMLMAEEGHAEAMEALLAAGRDVVVDLRDSNHTLLSALHLAAAAGHAACIRLLLSAGADATARDHQARTALHAAALQAKDEAVAALLHSEPVGNVNDVDALGCTAIRLASSGQNDAARASVVRQLLTAGADPALAPGRGKTALSAAAESGNDLVVTALLACGERAALEAKDRTGYTALARAVCAGHVSTVRLLLAAGADASARDSTGTGVLKMAISVPGSQELVDALLPAISAADLDYAPPGGETALWHAAQSGFGREAVLRLLEAGADPEAASAGPRTFLTAAARSRWKPDLFRALLAHPRCPDVNTAAADGSTALHSAARSGNADMVQALLSAGADAAALKACGSTVLMEAAWASDDGATARLLVESGRAGYVGARNEAGHTALHIAASRGNVEAVAALLEVLPPQSESTIHELFELVLASRKPMGIATLLAAGDTAWLASVDPDSKAKALLLAAKCNGEVLGALLAAGLEVGSWPPDCQTPLIAAAAAGCDASVEVLLRPEHAVAVDATDSSGRTALHCAVQAAHMTAALLLLQAGAIACTTSSDGVPALFAAVRAGCSALVVDAMLEAGASRVVNDGDRSRNPLLHIAVNAGALEAARCLVKAGADVWASTGADQPVLSEAVRQPHAEEFFDALLPSSCAADGATQASLDAVLRTAAELGKVRLVRLLADRGADVCSTGSTGETALLAASRCGRFDVVDFLLSDTESVRVLDQTANDGQSAVSWACRTGNARLLARLLRAGAKLATPSPHCASALQLAAGAGNAAVVKTLLAREQYDLDGRDGKWPAPLALAVQWGFPDVARYLLAAGADARQVPHKFMDGAHAAAGLGQAQAVSLVAAALEGGNLRFEARQPWGRRGGLVAWRSCCGGVK